MDTRSCKMNTGNAKKFSSVQRFTDDDDDYDDDPSRGNEGDDEGDQDDDEDDEDEVVMDEDDSRNSGEDRTTPSGSLPPGGMPGFPVSEFTPGDYNQPLSGTRTKLSGIQSRMDNFETILAHLRAQLTEIHRQDGDLLKKLALINDEIAEMNLVETYYCESSSRLSLQTMTADSETLHHHKADGGSRDSHSSSPPPSYHPEDYDNAFQMMKNQQRHPHY